MFKKLLITMLVVMAATSAMAGDMDWKFYGKLHTSIDYLSDGDESGLYMSNNTSRIGFKGSKPLNDDFAFVWQVESAVNVPQKEGYTGLASRNSYLGVKGNFGEFRWGRHDTPFKTLGRKVEFFYDELGDFRQATMGWDRRLNDVLAWVSPDWSGFGIFAAYMLDQSSSDPVTGGGEADNPTDPGEKALTAYSIMAHYSKDAFFIGAALEGLSDGYSPATGAGDDMQYGDAATGLRFAAKYNADKFAIAALYQTLSNNGGNWDTSGADPVWNGTSSNTFGLGALFRATETWGIRGQYYMVNPDTDAENVDGTDIDESDVNGSLLALAVEHRFSKAVMFYLQYASMMNGDNADFHLGGYNNGHGRTISGAMDMDAGTYKNPSGFSFGTVVKF